MDIRINDTSLRRALADIGIYPHEHYGIIEDIGHKAGLARISHTKKCIGAANQRKLLCHNDFLMVRSRPDDDRL